MNLFSSESTYEKEANIAVRPIDEPTTQLVDGPVQTSSCLNPYHVFKADKRID